MATTTTTPTENRWNKGNVYDRAARKLNGLRHWGNGTECDCVWCGRTLRDMGAAADGGGHPEHITFDHIVCHADGGRYTMTNLVPACDRCNKSRGRTPFRVWAERVGADADALIAHASKYRRRGRKG